MPWIEGVGDEVTVTFAILIGLTIILLAWVSTGIRDIPFISVIIVQLTRRRVRRENVDQPQSQNETVQGAATESQGEDTPSENSAQTVEAGTNDLDNKTANPEDEPSPRAESDSSKEKISEGHVDTIQASELQEHVSGPETQQSEESPIIAEESEISTAEIKNLNEQELRQRRLDFFRKGSQVLVESQTVELPKTEVTNSNTDTSELPLSTNTDNSFKSVQNVQSEESENGVGTSVDPIDTITQGQAGDQPDVSGAGHQDDEPSANEIRVRIKFFNDEQKLVSCSPMDTIGNFRRRHFSTELSESKLVRFIFNGQDLRNDSSTLQSYNIMDNSVLHCLITQPQRQDQPVPDDDDGLDMGLFMFPLFGLLLSVVWYMRFMYRQFFNVTSTLTLGGITFLYLAAFLSSFRGQQHEHLD